MWRPLVLSLAIGIGLTLPAGPPLGQAADTGSVGVGVSPIVGLRLGVSAARGEYTTRDEVTLGSGRTMTLVGFEGEYAVAHSKVSGELIRDSIETLTSSVRASTWFVQEMQTLTPRWSAGARLDGTSAPPIIGTTVRPISYRSFEGTATFRATREIWLRSSFYTRRFFAARTWDQQVGVSVVWNRRWW